MSFIWSFLLHANVFEMRPLGIKFCLMIFSYKKEHKMLEEMLAPSICELCDAHRDLWELRDS